jgi:hypothetical protein
MQTNRCLDAVFIKALQSNEDMKQQALSCKCEDSARILNAVSKFGMDCLSQAHSEFEQDDTILIETIGMLLQNEPVTTVQNVLSALVLGFTKARENAIRRPILVQ